MAAGERIRLRGVVQGVGLRPWVWRLATSLGLTGRVWNAAGAALVELWGDEGARRRFVERLAELPPPGRIEALECEPLEGRAPPRFEIAASRGGSAAPVVAPDTAPCPDCLRELFDPADRRHRYPFINCARCGPRLSIVTALPYDRRHTTMAPFPLCDACRAEYEDPADRRFHAEAIACPACGPRLRIETAEGAAEGAEALARARALLEAGGIVAVKGVGGYHLLCDAGDEAAVARLRRLKRRPAKPLALLARDVAMVRRHAGVAEPERALLEEPAAPLVVVEAAGEALAPSVAPGLGRLAFMLPQSPLHHLLMEGRGRPLVMTSGNRAGEPPVTGDDEARRFLAPLADALLLHDRAIVQRLDDAIVQVAAGRPRLLRRSRGQAPRPLPLPPGFEAAPPLLAMGAGLKNTFCLLGPAGALLSPHLGELDDPAARAAHGETIARWRRLFAIEPRAVVVDLHPDYPATLAGAAIAETEGLPLVQIQHHHAHIAATLAEQGWPRGGEAVLGIALDGSGLGTDGTLWGGEFLRVHYHDCERLACFEPVPLPGGEQALRQPWRSAWAHLHHALGWRRVAADYRGLDFVRALEGRPLALLERMAAAGVNAPATSSCGRLFDAMAALLGLCREAIGYEGQAAVMLEDLAAPAFARERERGYPHRFDEARSILRWAPLWRALLEDLARGEAPAAIAARGHWAVARAVVETARRLCARHGLATVALGGGVFQNRLLLEAVTGELEAAGLRVLAPARVPAGDGGLALGQALVGAARQIERRSDEEGERR